VPSLLVYGTPTNPAWTQASWFRAEDREAVKAAAKELKLAVIELQTEAEKALTAGVPERVLRGSGRMIVGSVSADVYWRIEEHARKGATANAPAQPENVVIAAAKPASEHWRSWGELAGTRSGHPGAADRQAGPRPRPRNLAGRC
jgi:hypothetical protein